MSYVSALKNIPNFLSQPTGIAAIASVGIHGAIAFILPLVPMDSQPKVAEAPKSVGLVELDQEEQSRLPNNIGNTPQIAGLPPQNQLQAPLPLPGFAIEPTSPPTELPSLPPPPASTSMILPPLPQSPSPNVASLPKSQSVQIVPRKSYEMNPSFKATQPQQSYPNYSFNSNNVEIGQPSTEPAAKSPVASSQRAKSPVASSQGYNLPKLAPAARPNNLPTSGTPIPYNTTRSVPIEGNPSSKITLPNTQILNNGQTQDFFAAPSQSPANNEIAVAGGNTPQWRQQPNGTSKSPQIAASSTNIPKTSFGEQLREVDQKYPNSETKLLISDTILTKSVPEGKVEGVLVVNPKGQVDYFAISDRSIPSQQKIAAREYFKTYFQKNPAQADGKAKKYPFRLAFSSKGNNAPLNDATKDITDRLRDAKEKPQNSLQQAATTPVIIKPSAQQQIIVKPSAPKTQNTSKPSLSDRLTNDKKPSVAKPQSTINTNQIINTRQPKPIPQAIKPPLTRRLIESQSESASPATPASSIDKSKKLIQQLRKVKEERQSSQ